MRLFNSAGDLICITHSYKFKAWTVTNWCNPEKPVGNGPGYEFIKTMNKKVWVCAESFKMANILNLTV